MLQRVSNMVWKSTRSSQYLRVYRCGCEWTRSDSGIMECSVGNSCCQVLSPHWLPGISGMGHITDEERQSGCTIQYAFNSIDQTSIASTKHGYCSPTKRAVGHQCRWRTSGH